MPSTSTPAAIWPGETVPAGAGRAETMGRLSTRYVSGEVKSFNWGSLLIPPPPTVLLRADGYSNAIEVGESWFLGLRVQSLIWEGHWVPLFLVTIIHDEVWILSKPSTIQIISSIGQPLGLLLSEAQQDFPHISVTVGRRFGVKQK